MSLHYLEMWRTHSNTRLFQYSILNILKNRGLNNAEFLPVLIFLGCSLALNVKLCLFSKQCEWKTHEMQCEMYSYKWWGILHPLSAANSWMGLPLESCKLQGVTPGELNNHKSLLTSPLVASSAATMKAAGFSRSGCHFCVSVIKGLHLGLNLLLFM